MFQVSKRLLSIVDYHKMAAIDILPDQGIELIEGEIIEMSPIGGKHITAVNRLNHFLSLLLENKAIVSVRNPIIIGDFSEPQPDISLLKYRSDFYGGKTPEANDVLLVIEVADTSLAYDREIKLPLYADSGIPEFWLVNLEQEEIEVYWEPIEKVYKNRTLFRSGDTVIARHLELRLEVKKLFSPE